MVFPLANISIVRALLYDPLVHDRKYVIPVRSPDDGEANDGIAGPDMSIHNILLGCKVIKQIGRLRSLRMKPRW